ATVGAGTGTCKVVKGGGGGADSFGAVAGVSSAITGRDGRPTGRRGWGSGGGTGGGLDGRFGFTTCAVNSSSRSAGLSSGAGRLRRSSSRNLRISSGGRPEAIGRSRGFSGLAG